MSKSLFSITSDLPFWAIFIFFTFLDTPHFSIFPRMDALVSYGAGQLRNQLGGRINDMMLRSGRRVGQNWIQNVRNAAGPYLSRARAARQRTFSNTRTRRRTRRATSAIGVTTQHDERRIYQKKRMPRSKRRRWLRFKNKVLAVGEKELGSRTIVYNTSNEFSNSTATSHGFACLGLYTGQGDASWTSDLSTLVDYENTGNPTAAAGDTVQLTSKFIFKSAIADFTFRNTSTVRSTGPVYALSGSAKLEVDVYELLIKRSSSDNVVTYQSVSNMFDTRGSDDTLTIGGGIPDLRHYRRGVSPWDLPHALSYFGIKILRKTKYMVPNGDTFTYQVRDPKRRVATRQRLDRIGGVNVPGWTRHLYVIFKLVPGLTVADSDGNYQERLTVGMTRKYFYKIEGIKEDRDYYLQN